MTDPHPADAMIVGFRPDGKAERYVEGRRHAGLRGLLRGRSRTVRSTSPGSSGSTTAIAPAGDRVLRTVATAIGDMLRVSDSLGRLGGEEFAILLPETPTLAARNLAERCRVAVGGLRTPVEDGTIAATSSFGIATYRPGIDTLDSWPQRADRALYQAKNEGRNRCVLSEMPADPTAETER